MDSSLGYTSQHFNMKNSYKYKIIEDLIDIATDYGRLHLGELVIMDIKQFVMIKSGQTEDSAKLNDQIKETYERLYT